MRVRRTEQIVLTADERNTLDELRHKLENLDTEDDDMIIIRNTLQEAITRFLNYGTVPKIWTKREE